MKGILYIWNYKYKFGSWFCGIVILLLRECDTVSTNITDNIQFYGIMSCALLVGCFQWRQHVLDKRREVIIEDLKKDVRALELIKPNIDRIIKCYLRDISRALKFDHDDRISLYIVLENEFAICSRVSVNPELEKIGRGSYPINQGIIAKAWEQNMVFENNIPQYAKKNKKYSNYFHKYYNMPVSVTEKLSMKSHIYFGRRIHDHNKANPIGVIIVESKKKNRFDKAELEKVLNGDDEYIYEMLKSFKDYIPTPKRTQREDGF